eukprot:2110272-Heterocapsa_arctica.AAC.1
MEARSSPASAWRVATNGCTFSRAATRPVQSHAAWTSGVASDDTNTTRSASPGSASRSRCVSMADSPV